jgi:hypothetical protein
VWLKAVVAAFLLNSIGHHVENGQLQKLELIGWNSLASKLERSWVAAAEVRQSEPIRGVVVFSRWAKFLVGNAKPNHDGDDFGVLFIHDGIFKPRKWDLDGGLENRGVSGENTKTTCDLAFSAGGAAVQLVPERLIPNGDPNGRSGQSSDCRAVSGIMDGVSNVDVYLTRINDHRGLEGADRYPWPLFGLHFIQLPLHNTTLIASVTAGDANRYQTDGGSSPEPGSPKYINPETTPFPRNTGFVIGMSLIACSFYILYTSLKRFDYLVLVGSLLGFIPFAIGLFLTFFSLFPTYAPVFRF